MTTKGGKPASVPPRWIVRTAWVFGKELRKKNFANPDVQRDVGRGILQIVELGDVAIGRIEYQPGWSWLEDLKERVGTETCEIRHMGVAP